MTNPTRTQATTDLDTLMQSMGYTSRQEAALAQIRRDAHYTLKTAGVEGVDPQARMDELCRYILDTVDAAGPIPAAPQPRRPLALLADQWEAWGADLDPALDDLGDLAAASARRACAGQLREVLRAQAEAEAREITWDAAVDRLMQGGNLVLTARGDSELLAALLHEASERLGDGEMHVHDEFEAGALWYQEQQAPTQGES